MSLNKMTLRRYELMVKKSKLKIVFFEETLFLPHEAALFFNDIKKSISLGSSKLLKKAFRHFNLVSVIVFGFLWCLYRLPLRNYKLINEVITSGIRSVLKR